MGVITCSRFLIRSLKSRFISSPNIILSLSVRRVMTGRAVFAFPSNMCSQIAAHDNTNRIVTCPCDHGKLCNTPKDWLSPGIDRAFRPQHCLRCNKRHGTDVSSMILRDISSLSTSDMSHKLRMNPTPLSSFNALHHRARHSGNIWLCNSQSFTLLRSKYMHPVCQ
jgi:hypothetical protein